MYQTLTNSGKKAELSALRSVVDLDGDILFQSIPKAIQVVDQQAAWLTTYAMKRGVIEGTGRYLQPNFSWANLAGKTGTSNNTRDSWFVGIDGREVTTVWLGRDDNKSTKLTGASGALRVYAEYLSKRIPEKLTLPWPQEIRSQHFSKTPKGDLDVDCGSDFTLPIWDINGHLKSGCQDTSATWLKRIFDW
jgi:penicillin-binding protein 1B